MGMVDTKELKDFFKNSGPLWDKDDMIEAYMEHSLFLTGIPDFSSAESYDDQVSILKDFLMEYSNRFFDQTMDGVCNVITSFEKQEELMEEEDMDKINKLTEIKLEVEKRLMEEGIKVHFFSFEYDEDNLYFGYTFNKHLIDEAKECWSEGLILQGCYDDYSFEEDFEDIVKDICKIVSDRKKELN